MTTYSAPSIFSLTSMDYDYEHELSLLEQSSQPEVKPVKIELDIDSKLYNSNKGNNNNNHHHKYVATPTTPHPITPQHPALAYIRPHHLPGLEETSALQDFDTLHDAHFNAFHSIVVNSVVVQKPRRRNVLSKILKR